MKTKIILEDDDIIICHKPAGLATQTIKLGQKDLESELKNYLSKTNLTGKEPYIGLINRLDQPVEGLVMIAKNEKVARILNAQLTERDSTMKKYYYVIVEGCPVEKKGVLVNNLLKDKKTNLSYVVEEGTPEAKYAKLAFRVVKKSEDQKTSLLEVILKTGRHHQIRAQLAYAGMPIIGDCKYGRGKRGDITALCAYKLIINHPVTGKGIIVEIEPDGSIFKEYQ